MKKHSRLFPVPLPILLLCALSFRAAAVLVPHLVNLRKPVTMLIIGAAVMLPAIPCHIFAERDRPLFRLFYIPVLLLNTLGTAIFEAAYYTQIEVVPTKAALIEGLLLPTVLCLLTALSGTVFLRKYAWSLGTGAVISFGSAVTAIVFWVMADGAEQVTPSFAFFCFLGMLVAIMAAMIATAEAVEDAEIAEKLVIEQDPYALPVMQAETPTVFDVANEDTKIAAAESAEANGTSATIWGWLHYLSLASFGLLILVGVVVAIIIALIGGDCDCGDCCDGCDCPGGSGGKKKRR